MKVTVWNIHAVKKDEGIIHFEIVVPAGLKNIALVYNYSNEFFKSKDLEVDLLSSVECSILHWKDATHEIILEVKKKGYYIIEIDGCN
jgi:hypothetical protein